MLKAYMAFYRLIQIFLQILHTFNATVVRMRIALDRVVG